MDKETISRVETVAADVVPELVDIALVAVHVPAPVASLVRQLVHELWHLKPPVKHP